MKDKNQRLITCCHPSLTEAGCDEAGRGCFAGPVFAAAVILPSGYFHPLLNDSKQTTRATRMVLKNHIELHAMAWAVAMVDVEEIDQINILKASQKAMHLALNALAVAPAHIAVDGNYFIPYKNIPYRCIIKGDGKYANIAAASILAKTSRDAYMEQLHEQHPQYNWRANKGYGTAEHRRAILQHGLCPQHRRSFNILPKQMPLF